MSTSYWTRAIEEARQRQQQGQVPFTKEQIEKSSSWLTCSFGETDSELMGSLGMPRDAVLFNLGICFYDAVRNQRVSLAAMLIDEIEYRIAGVLAKLDQQQEND